MLRIFVLFVCVLSLQGPAWAGEGNDGKSVVPPREKAVMGWLESIYLKPWNKRLTAKLDTGAKTSSLHSDKIERFSKGGEAWVRFTLGDMDDGDEKPIVVERPLVRTAYIKSHQREVSKRDVVSLTVCKNGKDYSAEFNLVDRSKFNYPVLLGRSFLKDIALVDPDSTFLFKGETDPCLAASAMVPAPAPRP